MRLVFVTPRYGPDILGGAESLARSFAERLVQQGFIVEVWTTNAQNYHTWEEVYPIGVEVIKGVVVRRFPTFMRSNTHPNDKVITKAFGNFPATPEAEYNWIDQGMNSPQLYDHLMRNGKNFDHLIFLPYPFGFTCYGASIYPQKSIIWPCLHNDPVAYFEPVRVMLNQAKGVILNSDAEKNLFYRLQVNNPNHQVIGYGLEMMLGDMQRFHDRFPQIKAPFLLYAGRLEKSKNVHLLIDYFIKYIEKQGGDLNLVLIGKGPVTTPAHPQIFALGYVSEQEKYDAYAAATLLCQPSQYESFGITLLEAWLQETPILVHRDCQVTLEHCLSAQGGLYFQDDLEFGEVLNTILTQPNLARQMGINGKHYVQTNYSWDGVIKKLVGTLTSWQTNQAY